MNMSGVKHPKSRWPGAGHERIYRREIDEIGRMTGTGLLYGLAIELGSPHESLLGAYMPSMTSCVTITTSTQLPLCSYFIFNRSSSSCSPLSHLYICGGIYARR